MPSSLEFEPVVGFIRSGREREREREREMDLIEAKCLFVTRRQRGWKNYRGALDPRFNRGDGRVVTPVTASLWRKMFIADLLGRDSLPDIEPGCFARRDAF